MKVGVIPENILERAALTAGAIPRPLFDTHIAMMLARSIMAGTKLGVFEALADGSLQASQIATRCGTEPHATEKLLITLTGAGYLRNENQQYSLAPVARTWLLESSPKSLRDKLLFQFHEWNWIGGYEEYICSGTSRDLHQVIPEGDEAWGTYQRAMRALASSSASEVARRIPVPKGARKMLDIGGSHGYYSVALCRRHPELQAVILDLPQAVKHAAPLLAKEGMGERVRHQAGDALKEDLGTATWDVVFISSLVHHFDQANNRSLVQRVARALRPGGILVIQDFIHQNRPGEAGQVAALIELYFAMTSQSGSWSVEEIAGWQKEAGLMPHKPRRLLSVPGVIQQTASKSI